MHHIVSRQLSSGRLRNVLCMLNLHHFIQGVSNCFLTHFRGVVRTLANMFDDNFCLLTIFRDVWQSPFWHILHKQIMQIHLLSLRTRYRNIFRSVFSNSNDLRKVLSSLKFTKLNRELSEIWNICIILVLKKHSLANQRYIQNAVKHLRWGFLWNDRGLMTSLRTDPVQHWTISGQCFHFKLPENTKDGLTMESNLSSVVILSWDSERRLPQDY